MLDRSLQLIFGGLGVVISERVALSKLLHESLLTLAHARQLLLPHELLTALFPTQVVDGFVELFFCGELLSGQILACLSVGDHTVILAAHWLVEWFLFLIANGSA